MSGWKTWQKAALGAGLAVVVAVPAAMAAGRHMRGQFVKHMIDQRVSDAEDYVDATPRQREIIDAAKLSVMAKVETRMKAKGAQREQWIELFSADNLDAQRIYAEADKRAEEIKSLAREIVPEIQKVHDALTPAQRHKLAEHAKTMHRRFDREE